MRPLTYKLIRSNRKTISLTVDKTGMVVLRAPNEFSSKRADEFVLRHLDWITERRKILSEAPKLDLADGAELILFGKAFRIATGRGDISEPTIFLPETDREKALTRILKKLSLEKMSILTAQLAEEFGFRYSGVRISSARGRWGSCNRKGMIAYTFRVAFLPIPLVEYIAVHELAHTVCFDHSRDFWRAVEKALPDWKMRRKSLKSINMVEFL